MEDKNLLRKVEDRRIEYSALRTEILQADNLCLLMTGYIIAAVGFLYSVNTEWLVSFLSLIGLFYYTEKRFSIRNIADFIRDKISLEDSGFGWEKNVTELRNKKELRPSMRLRPYNAEVILCVLVALSPLSRWHSFLSLKPTTFFWALCTLPTVVLAVINWKKYQKLGEAK